MRTSLQLARQRALTMKRVFRRLVDRRPGTAEVTTSTTPGPDGPPRPAADVPPGRATMHSLTVEAIRMLVGIGVSHAEDIDPQTAQSLEYCLSRMERYARDDWTQIRDLQPLLLVLRRRNPRRPLTFP